MDHVKTFFKTLLRTIILLIIIVGGSRWYVRLINKDLWAKVANIVHKSEIVECPICKECKEPVECPICEDGQECPTCQICEEGEINTTDTSDIKDINNKLDKIIEIMSNIQPTAGQASELTKPKSQEEIIADLQKRLEQLETQ